MESQCHSGAVYLITVPESLDRHRFKFGKTTKTKEQLLKRYQTALPGAFIVDFFFHEQFSLIEAKVKDLLKDHRERNENNGGLSEWIVMSLHDIRSVIRDVIVSFDDEKK